MLDDLAVVRLIVKAEDSAEVFAQLETLVTENESMEGKLTKLQVLLWATHELGNPHRQTF